MANLITRSISMPEEIFEEIDDVAEAWYTNRSHAFIRIYQEWKQFKRQQSQQLPGLTPPMVIEAPAIPAEVEAA